MENDRELLLEAQTHLERGLKWVQLYRATKKVEKMEKMEEKEGEEVAVLHGELCYVLTRVRVKLAATVPPPGENSLLSSNMHTHLQPSTVCVVCVLCVCL